MNPRRLAFSAVLLSTVLTALWSSPMHAQAATWLTGPVGGSGSVAQCPQQGQWLLLYWGGASTGIADVSSVCPGANRYWANQSGRWIGFNPLAVQASDTWMVQMGEADFVGFVTESPAVQQVTSPVPVPVASSSPVPMASPSPGPIVSGTPIPVGDRFASPPRTTPATTGSTATAQFSTYTNQPYRWSVSYPTDWKLDSTNAADVRLLAPLGFVDIASASTPEIESLPLDILVDVFLRTYEAKVTSSGSIEGPIVTEFRRPTTVSGEFEAVELTHIFQIKLREGNSAIPFRSRVTLVRNGSTFVAFQTAAPVVIWGTLEPTFTRVRDSFIFSR